MPMCASSPAQSSPVALTLVSDSGKRMHPRVAIPLAVEFEDGERRPAKDWSVAGFSLLQGGPIAREGTIHRVGMHFGLSDCEVAIEADAKVSWMVGTRACGFRFVGLSPDKARILDHFIQSGLEGDGAVVGGIPIAHRAGVAVGPPRALVKVTHGAFHAGRLLLLAAAVLGGAAFVLSRLLTVTTDYAAVAADLQQLHAPEAGFLRSDRLVVGTHFKAGQAIGSMQPVATPQTRLATETQIVALQSTLEQQSAALDQAKAGFSTFLRASQTDVAEANAARSMLEQQVAAEDKMYQRFVTLKQKGVVADARVDQEQQVLLTLKRNLSTARDAESAMREKLSNAEAGRFLSDGRSTQKSPADLQRDVRTTEATIARLKAVLASLDEPLPILSPCDCTVTALGATPGAYVAVGAHLADLARDGDGHVAVDALVQNPRLNFVREGQAVTVYLANHPEGMAGRVTAINFNPANTGRTGLPTSLRTLDDYGLMTVAVEAPLSGLPSGMPATVMAPITWRSLVANTPLMAWTRNLLDTSPGPVERVGARAPVAKPSAS